MNDNDLLDKYGLSPKSAAPIKAQTEGDELLSKYGLRDIPTVIINTNKDDNEDVAPSKPSWWKVNNEDTSYDALAKKFGISVLRGAKDVLDTGAHGLANAASYVADKVLPENLASDIKSSAAKTILEDTQARNEYDKQYPASNNLLPNLTDVGRFGGQIAATAPLMPAKAFEGIAAAAKALPTVSASGAKIAAPLVNRLTAAAGQGALGGSVFNAATSSTNNKSLAENVGEGALTGGLAGPLVVGAFGAGKGLASKIAGSISPERADLAKKAAQYGIDLDAGQVSDNSFFKKYNQVSGWLPFSGANKASEKQLGQFTKAVSNTFGEDTNNITPQVLKSAKQRLGSNYDTVAAHTNVQADPRLARDLAKVAHEAKLVLDENQYSRFEKQMDQIIAKFQQGNGAMDGKAWQAMRHTGSPLSRLISGRDTDLGVYAKGLKIAMDAAFNRSAPADMQTLLQKTNQQYKAMKTVEKLANFDADGHVSPMKLMSKVVNAPGGKLGSGQLGDLADIGRAFFPQPADSGTPLGEALLEKVGHAVSSPVTALGGAVSTLLTSSAPYLHTAEGLAGLTANRYVRKAVNSKIVKEAIVNSAQGNVQGRLSDLVGKTIPYSSNLLENKKEKKISLPVALQ